MGEDINPVAVYVTEGVEGPMSPQNPSKQRNRKKKKNKGHAGEWRNHQQVKKYDVDDRWGNGKKFPDPWLESDGTTTLIDYSLKIPPVPARYNMADPKFINQFNYQPPSHELTLEEENEIRMRLLRETKIFKSCPIRYPEWIPTKVDFLGFTEGGTVIFRFTDKKNLAHFSNLEGRITVWFFVLKTKNLDTRIRKEDVQKDLIVLARAGTKHWIRAKILDFDEEWISVVGVDELVYKKLPYDRVHYFTKMLYDCPFQIVECHLSGLQKWEDSGLTAFFLKRLFALTNLSDFYVMKIKKDKKKRHIVDIEAKILWADDTEGKNVYQASLNAILLEHARKFDPFKDFLVTP